MNEPLSDVRYDDLLPALVEAPCPLEAINLVLGPLAFAAALDARATISSFSFLLVQLILLTICFVWKRMSMDPSWIMRWIYRC